jgi:outer membrane protein OmpA-like peptidoglycan-associated protein
MTVAPAQEEWAMMISRRGAGLGLFGTMLVGAARPVAAQPITGLSEQLAPRAPAAPFVPRPGSNSMRGPAELGSGITVQETERGTVMSVQGDVLFAFDSYELRPSSREVLGRVVAYIQQRRPPRIAVEGNTDAVGSPAYNVALGQNRARSVVAFLVQAGGLPPGIFTMASYGATRPAAPNTNPDGSDNPEGRARNRRVDIILER